MSTKPQQTPTKEQLKKWAGAPTLPSPTPQSQSSEVKTSQNLLAPGELDLEKLRSVRPISARAVPKAIFTALLLSPVFLVAFVFVNGLKLPSQNNTKIEENAKTENVKSGIESDADDETTQLKRELAQTKAQLALIQQNNKQVDKPKSKERTPSKAKAVVPRKAAPTRVATRTTIPRQRVQPVQAIPRATVSVPRQKVYSSAKVTKSVAPKPAQSNQYRQQIASVKPNKSVPVATVSVDPQEWWQQLAHLGSYGGIPAEVPQSSVAEALQESVIAQNTSETLDNSSYQPAVYQISSKPSKPAQPEELSTPEIQQPPAIEPELEAPILQGQPRQFISAGTTAKALLVTPFAWDQTETTLGEHFTVILADPLLTADGTVAMPAKTQLLVKARSLSESGLVRLVAVAAIIQQDGQQYEVALSENAIGIRGLEGKPLIAQKLSNKKREIGRRDATRFALGAIGRATGLINRPRSESVVSNRDSFSSSIQNRDPNLLAGILEGGTDAILDDLDERNAEAIAAIEQRPDVFFLKAGTGVEVFVNESTAVDIPGFNQPILESSQPIEEPEQLALSSEARFDTE